MRKIRCAIYTRKSSEEGLDQAFNSLHAQREACAAYIASQKHEGWVALPDAYDDGGISGGTLERAGLKRLLKDVDDGLVDQIVVYKIDRLTRSLADFAKLVERLDAAQASFVSVTQSFNTATSMGRLTLNVLLSFAQFEREVTAERIRDKIAASKKKGLWMGGSIPFGYEPDGRTLKIVAQEAETVRAIFDLYLTYGSLNAVQREAERLGLRGRPRSTTARNRRGSDGDPIVLQSGEAAIVNQMDPGSEHSASTSTSSLATPFERGNIHYILTNPVYAGRIRHHRDVHEGQHPAIIDPAVWDDVQERMRAAAARQRGWSGSGSKASPLVGRLKDETGDRLTPTHAGANGKRYRYYVSNRLSLGATGEGTSTPGGWRLPAKALEDQVAGAVLAHLSARLPVDLLTSPSADVIARLDTHLAYLAARVGAKGPGPILDCVAAVKISPGQVEVQLDHDRTADCLEIAPAELAEAALAFTTPFRFRKRGVEMKLVIGAVSLASLDATLIRSIAKAHLYYEAIKEGRSFDEIATSENLSRRRILQVIDLAFMAPDLVRTILRGEQPIGLTAKWLGINPLPSDWDEQRRIVATR